MPDLANKVHGHGSKQPCSPRPTLLPCPPAGAALPPSFHTIPESQPVLPCLLRRLLQRDATHEARALALRHAASPHFTRSMEWLLFTALEAAVEAAGGGGGDAQVRALGLGRPSTGDG